MIDILCLTGLGADDYQPGAILCVANFGAAGNVFGITRLRHKIRNDGVLGSGAWFADSRDDIFPVRRQVQIDRILARGDTERFSLLALFPLLLLLFALLRAFTHGIQQAALFLLQSLLAVRSLRRGTRHAASTRPNIG